MTEPHLHDHDPNDLAHDPASEDFPRVELSRLVGQAQARTRMRRTAQALLLSVGLALVALGLPTERYFDGMEALWQLVGSGPPPQSGIALPILGTHAVFGIGLEPAGFLWAAILYGASVFLLLRLTQSIGFDHGVALASALLAVLTPLAWLGGTLPLDFSAGLLGSTLLCTSLFQVQQKRSQGYLWRAAIYWVLAFLLQPECAWLLPATLWAVYSQGKSQELGHANAIGLSVVCLVSVWTSVQVGGGHWSDFVHSIVGSTPGSPSWLAGIGFWGLGFGIAWLGLTHLLIGRREAEEQSAPTWVLAWVVVGVAPILTGGLLEGPRGAFLVPMAAVGVADWLTRRVHDDRRTLWAGALVGAQLLLTYGSTWLLSHQNPSHAWSSQARNHLLTTDWFVSPSAPHAYLAQFRLGVPTTQTGVIGDEIRGISRMDPVPNRVVLDGWDGEFGGVLIPDSLPPQTAQDGHEKPSTWVLTKEGLIPAQQVP